MATPKQHLLTKWFTPSNSKAADFEVFEDDTAGIDQSDADGTQDTSDEDYEDDSENARFDREDDRENAQRDSEDEERETDSTQIALYNFCVRAHKLIKEDESAPGWLTTLYENPVQLLQHLEEANVQLADWLLPYLEDPEGTIPTITTFANASLEVKLGFGVYVLTLQKDKRSITETEFLLYCGSGTRKSGGVKVRLNDYDIRSCLPTGVAQALEHGYQITNKCLVAWCPLPKEYLYCDRALILIIERMFKGGAIRITKLPSTDGEVAIHVREQQSAAVETAAKKHTKAQGSKTTRERGLETWLGELDCAIDRLTELLKDLIPKTDRDPDAQNGLRIMVRIATRVGERIKPMAEKYREDRKFGQKRADTLADLLFKHEEDVDGTYEMLETMQGLHTYLAYIRGSLRGMYPASQALWDKDCIQAVTGATEDVAKMEEWCLQQMQFRSPQTLLVPLPLKEGGRR